MPKTRKKLRERNSDNGAEYSLAIAFALKQEFGDSRHAVKKLVRWTGASERTVQNWLGGVRGPSGHHLMSLAKHSLAVHGAYLSMTGRDIAPPTEVEACLVLLKKAVELLSSG
ncbi:hypothetical protein [Burkholderia sp. 22PA0106]|uniref:hypothetical protein n=1 Tax=Burkholderia sp. 22PA0106 TaxID=3237371 RepID=UPI0039C39836